MENHISVFKCSVSFQSIQGDSGGKFSNVVGNSIDHCEKRSSYENLSYSDWLPKQICLNLSITRQYEW